MKNTIIILALVIVSCTAENETNVEDVVSPANLTSEEPAFFQISESKLGLSWMEKEGDKSLLKYATYEDSKWSASSTIASGNDWFVNWADFPGVVANDTHWLAWFLQKSDTATFAYDVMITQSNDNGISWSAPFKLHNDSTHTEHGFVSAVATKKGFQLIWLDGRNTGGAAHGAGAMSIRSAHVDFEGVISNRKLLDDRTCDCCQTSLANTGDDAFIALYRDRSIREIRDIAFVNFNKEQIQSSPKIINPDNWKIAGCPVNGPRVVSNGNNTGVAWFTMSDTLSNVLFSSSLDGGITFSEPIVVETGTIGRVDVLVNKNDFYVSYIDETTNGTVLKIAKINNNELVNTYSISPIISARKTGFPRMAQIKNGLFMAYTGARSNKLELKSVHF